MQPPTIRANLLEPILEAVQAKGHDTVLLLRRNALPATPIDPYQLIRWASTSAFLSRLLCCWRIRSWD